MTQNGPKYIFDFSEFVGIPYSPKGAAEALPHNAESPRKTFWRVTKWEGSKQGRVYFYWAVKRGQQYITRLWFSDSNLNGGSQSLFLENRAYGGYF